MKEITIECDYEQVTIEHVEALRATNYALLCRHATSGREAWIPQSQIHDDSEVFAWGHIGKLVIPRWLAEREGFV